MAIGENNCEFTPSGYLSLIGDFIKNEGDDSINASESHVLFETADNCDDPVVRHIYAELIHDAYNQSVSQGTANGPKFLDPFYIPGYFTTGYLKDKGPLGSENNFCINFTGQTIQLPCEPASSGIFGLFRASRMKIVEVPTIKYVWSDRDDLSVYAKRAQAWFSPIDQRHIPIGEGVRLIQQNIGVMSLVEYALPRLYYDCMLPEAASLLTNVLLNTFLLSDEISADVKRYYLLLVERAVTGFNERFNKRKMQFLMSIGNKTPVFEERDGKLFEVREVASPEMLNVFIDKVKLEKGEMLSVWRSHISYLEGHMEPERFERWRPVLEGQSKAIDAIVSTDPDTIRYKLKDTRYSVDTATIFSQYAPDYTAKAKGYNDHLLDSLGIDGALGGAVLYSLVAKKLFSKLSTMGKVGVVGLLVLGGELIEVVGKTLWNGNEKPSLLPLILPDMSRPDTVKVLE